MLITQYPSSWIADKDANQCRDDGNTNGINKCVDGLVMLEKLMKVFDSKGAVFVGKCIIAN